MRFSDEILSPLLSSFRFFFAVIAAVILLLEMDGVIDPPPERPRHAAPTPARCLGVSVDPNPT